jgi:integrase/recombinase XerD
MDKRVRVSVLPGPLAPFAARYESWLGSRSYTASAAADRLCQLGQLSRWLERERLGVGELTDEHAGRFVAARRAAGWVSWVSPRSVMLPLAFLREVGAVPASVPVPADGPLEELLAEYQRYLLVERRLCEHTVFDEYGPPARVFLEGFATLAELRQLSAADVTSFLVRECPRRGASRARNLVCAVRSLLRYLHVVGVIETPLVWAVPSVADLRDRTLPRGLEPATVSKLLASCDRRTLLGRRDHAILLLLSRLGLRAGEVAAVRLDDIDWRAGFCSFVGRAAAGTCCRCRSMSARRSCPTSDIARGASVGRCSCGSPPRGRG